MHVGGLWAGDWIMKALAMGLKRNIITISTACMCLHTPELLDVNVEWGKMACVSYPSSQSRQKRDLPLEVLDKDTWYMVFNGKDHYWPAFLTRIYPYNG